MKLKPKDLEDFKSLWKKSFGEEISDEDAINEANALIAIVKIVAIKRIPIESISQLNLL